MIVKDCQTIVERLLHDC